MTKKMTFSFEVTATGLVDVVADVPDDFDVEKVDAPGSSERKFVFELEEQAVFKAHDMGLLDDAEVNLDDVMEGVRPETD
jgi:hypothetical protein